MSSAGNPGRDSLKPSSDDDYWNVTQSGFSFDGGGFSSTATTNQNNASGYEKDGFKRGNETINSRTVIKTGLNSPDYKKANIPFTKLIPVARKSTSSLNQQTEEKSELVEKTLDSFGVVKKIILGLDYNLYPFKSLSDKKRLLNAAVLSHDGDAIIVIILFLKSSLKRSLFLREITLEPVAVNMYLTYLREANEKKELTDMLSLLGKADLCGFMKYEETFDIQDRKGKHNHLKYLSTTYCQAGQVNRYLHDSVIEYIMCLEDYEVLTDHKVISNKCDNIFESVLGKEEISDSSAVDLLIFSLLHYTDLPEISSISPSFIKKRYKMNSQKFECCVLMAFAASRNYQNLENLFLAKKWFGGVKIKSYMPYQDVLAVLFKFDVPLEVMEKFCNAVSNEQEKLTLAKKYNCNQIVIEILKKRRTKAALLEFQRSLPEDSYDYQFILKVLSSADIKWKK